MAGPRLVARLGLDTKQFDRKVRGAKRTVTRFGRDLERTGRGLTVGLTVPMVGIGAAAVVAATRINESMANVATLIPGATDRVEELRAQVQGLAQDHGKDTQDLASGLYQTISAFGDDGAQTMQRLRISSMAASAGVATTEDAVNLLSASTKAYGDTSAGALQQVSDLAFETVRLGQTSFPELAANMGKVLPLSARLNISQEELYATMATLTGVTGNTSEVSTQLSGVYAALIKPTTDLQKAVKALNPEYSSVADVIQAEGGVVPALRALMGTTDGSNEAAAKLFGRVEGLRAIFALTGPQAAKFESTLAAMGEAAGATERAFEAQTTGINKAGHEWNRAKAAMQVAAEELGERLLPHLTELLGHLPDVVDRVDELVAQWNALPGPVRQTVVVLLGATAAAGPLLIAVGKITTGLKVLAPAWVLVRSKTKLATGTMKGATLGTYALSTAAKTLWRSLLGPVGIVLALGSAAVALKKFWDAYSAPEQRAKRTREAVARLDEKINELRGSLDDLSPGQRRLLEELEYQRDGLQRTADALEPWRQGIGGMGTVLPQVVGGLSAVPPPLRTIREESTNVASAWERAKRAGDEFLATANQIAMYQGQDVNQIDAAGAIGGDFIREQGTALGGDFAAAFEAGWLQGAAGLPARTVPILGAIGTLPTWEQSGLAAAGAFSTAFQGFGGDISATLVRALEGGGSWTGAIQSLGVQAGDRLAQSLTTTLTSAMGKTGGFLASGFGKFLGDAMGMAIPLVGPLVGLGIQKIFGALKRPSDAELAARQQAQDYEDTVVAALSDTQMAEAAAAGWESVSDAAFLIGIRDAFVATGRTAQEAETLVGQYWDVVREGDHGRMRELEQEFETARQGAAALGAEAERAFAQAAEAADRMSRTVVGAYETAQRAGETAYDQAKRDAIEAGATEEQAVKRAQAAREDAIQKTLQAERDKHVRTAAFEAALAEIRAGNAAGALEAARRAADQTAEAWNLALGAVQEADDATNVALNETTAEREQRQQEAALKAQEANEVAAEKTEQAWQESLLAAAGETETFVDAQNTALANIQDVDVRVRYHLEQIGEPPDLTGRPGLGDGRRSRPGRASGTHGRLVDFGRETGVYLHGRQKGCNRARGPRRASEPRHPRPARSKASGTTSGASSPTSPPR